MKTVTEIIALIYEDDDAAAGQALGVGRTAVANWRNWGYFPARVVVPILLDAKEKGIKLDIDAVPTKNNHKSTAA